MLYGAFVAVFCCSASAPAVHTPWHVSHVELHIVVKPELHQLAGVARLTLSPAMPASELLLDFSDSLTLDSARITRSGGAPIAGVRESGHIRFDLPGSAAGTLVHASVWYHGQPARRAIGMTGAAPAYRVATFGLPRSAREWWPGLDDPAEKADSADLWITAPANLTVVSIGRRIAREPDPGAATTTTHWAERHPVHPDAISFAIGDYAVTESTVTVTHGRRMPVQFYLFPEDSAKGAVDFAPVPEILAFMQQRLGAYPFGDEKYALVEFARPSFREAQTLSHLGAGFLTGHHDAEQVIAHEIAHQWFGNSLSVRSWEEIWLNESLAEYLAWQWIRSARGDSAYRALIDSAVAGDVAVPIVPANPADFRTLFGKGTFQRGPVILDLLERQIGSRAFQSALREYVARHAYGTVQTSDFQEACERASGKRLDAFFAKWVRGDARLATARAG